MYFPGCAHLIERVKDDSGVYILSLAGYDQLAMVDDLDEPSPAHSKLSLGLAIISVIWYIFLLSLGILGCWTAYVFTFVANLVQTLTHCICSRKRYRLRPRSPLASAAPNSVPGVSIIRPLKGLDANLYENLESTFTQEYPNYEIFLAVASEHDQALSVVRDLIAKYPQVNAHIIIGVCQSAVCERETN